MRGSLLTKYSFTSGKSILTRSIPSNRAAMQVGGTLGENLLRGNVPDFAEKISLEAFIRHGEPMVIPVKQNAFHVIKMDFF